MLIDELEELIGKLQKLTEEGIKVQSDDFTRGNIIGAKKIAMQVKNDIERIISQYFCKDCGEYLNGTELGGYCEDCFGELSGMTLDEQVDTVWEEEKCT